MFLCVAAAAHFGAVQYMRILESDRTNKRAGLVKAKPIAEKLLKHAHEENIPLMQLLSKFAPLERDLTDEELAREHHTDKADKAAMAILTEEELAQAPKNGVEAETAASTESKPPGGEGQITSFASVQSLEAKVTHHGRRKKFRSEEAAKENVTEADLLFIMYARDIFKKFDRDESNLCSATEILRMFTFFGIYMSYESVVKVVCMFLRDKDHATPMDESMVELNFSQLTFLLISVESYILRTDYSIRRLLTSTKDIRGFFASMPPSLCWDVVARALWPVLITLQIVVYFLLIPYYSTNLPDGVPR
mmetsp:Transcript_94818/g.267887  ORF Transcript_94818/g.267887 Transcript_94818/m.267887 type:complete len:306 (+) Transcript_94818:482-1399(+)